MQNYEKRNEKSRGGGVDSLLSTSNNKNNNENKKCCVKVATRKWQINEQIDFVKLIMWLLVFSIMFVLSLQPVFASKSKISQAGQTSGGVAYNNAPQTIIDSGNALFTETGVNTSVILDLLNKVNNASVWSSVTKADGSAVTYQTARNFGEYSANGTANTNGNAQMMLKLLSNKTFSSEVKTTYNFYDGNNTVISVTGSELTEFTKQNWQVVYRSTSADEVY